MPINVGLPHGVHFSVLITSSILFFLFLLFLQIMIHIQSNMLKSLIDILKDATEGNLSRFVKKHVFSEEVVSRRLPQKSCKGARTPFKPSTWYLNPVGHLFKETVQSGNLSVVPVARFLCVGADFFPLTQENFLWNSRKTCSFYVVLFPTLSSWVSAPFFSLFLSP